MSTKQTTTESAALAALKEAWDFAVSERCSYYGSSASTVARVTGMSRKAASSALRKLERKGLASSVVLRCEKRGHGNAVTTFKAAHWTVTPAGREEGR